MAVVYGQDTEQGESGDETPDTGYVIYPALQGFLDPVFTLDKDVDTTIVPTAGGVATYTLTLRSYDFGPLTSVTAFDLLPPQVDARPTTRYVAGSTVVTYPDLFQSTADPAVDTRSGERTAACGSPGTSAAPPRRLLDERQRDADDPLQRPPAGRAPGARRGC